MNMLIELYFFGFLIFDDCFLEGAKIIVKIKLNFLFKFSIRRTYYFELEVSNILERLCVKEIQQIDMLK